MKKIFKGLFLFFGIAIAIACCFNWTPAKAAGPENGGVTTAINKHAMEVVQGKTLKIHLHANPRLEDGPCKVKFQNSDELGNNRIVNGYYRALPNGNATITITGNEVSIAELQIWCTPVAIRQ